MWKSDIDYEVIRYLTPPSEVRGLKCLHCNHFIFKKDIVKPKTSKSGLGRYNKLRAAMLKHLTKEHRR